MNKGTSVKRDVVTDADGQYLFVNIEPGMYDLLFQAPGFQRATVTGYELLARQAARVDSNLTLATQTESVTVTAAMEAPIQTEVSNIAETKVGRELIDLPVAIASRAGGSTSPITTLTTQPGVQTDNSGNISVAGAKPSMLSMTLDGVSTSSAKSGAPIAELFPSFEGIAEIRVSEVNNTAEFGGVSDITTISKSGNNTYHGSLFENFQNQFMNSRNPFSATVPKLVMNDFGGSIGGPLSVPKLYHAADKTFFFADFEGLNLPRSSTTVTSIPTAAIKSGDLSVYLPTVIKDPLGGTFSGNQIPLTRITPYSQRIMDFYWPSSLVPNFGAPGAIANNYSANYPTTIVSNQGDIRIDHNITPKQTAFARLTYKRRQTLTAASGAPVLGGGNNLENDYSLSGAHNYILSPSMVNEARFGWSGQNTANQQGYTSAQVVDALGLILPGPAPTGAASTNVSITGFTGTSGGTTSISRASVVQLLDNLTWTKSRHTIKFGGDYRYQRGLSTNVFASGRMGSYTFNNAATVTKPIIGNPFAAFLLGIPDSTGLTTVQSPDSDGRANHFAFYIQDDWKITQRLTINYGLRWEYHPSYNDALHNLANFLPDYTSVIDGQTVHGAVVVPDESVALIDPSLRASIAPTPFVTTSSQGIPDSTRFAEKTDFAPRIGFAWRVTKDGKTVIRGGFGRFIEAEAGSGINAAWAVEASFVGRYTNTIVNGKPTLTFPYPFPANLAQPGTESFQLASAIHYKDPYVHQWNFTFERDLGFSTGLRVTYDGSHGYDLGLQYNANQIPANTIGYANSRAAIPYPLFNSISMEDNGGRSNYHAITVTANRRFSKGLQFQASYAAAKNLSNAGGASPTGFASEAGGTVTDKYNYDLDYGNQPYTRRHRFQTTFLYVTSLTGHNAILRHAVTGWEVAGVLLFQTGPFLTLSTSGTDPAGTSTTGGGSGRPDIVPGVAIYPVNQGPNSWVNAAAFVNPAANIGRYGNSSVGAILGPGTQAVSMSLFRTIPIKERVKLRVGVSAANALNHPNYGNPALTLGNASFGTITTLQSAEGSGPRQMQLTGRITF